MSYNSCRDRHCPKCQAAKQAEWLAGRLERLLPVEYFHVVFTLPEQLKPLALKNRRVLYDLLFRAASQTLLELAADPRRLGAQIGFTAVLHTWGQNLLFHPHLHCVVTGGGLSPDGTRWIPARQGYLLPVQVLAKLFRGKFLAGLKEAYQSGELRLTGSVAPLADPHRFRQLLDTLYRQNWVVYAKRPFGGARQVYRYLGRYTHRVAISNARLLAKNEAGVRFRYRDYRDAGRNATTKLARCQALFEAKANVPQHATSGDETIPQALERQQCPRCHQQLQRWTWEAGNMPPAALIPTLCVPILDSS